MQLSGSVNQAIGLDYRDSEPADGFFLAEFAHQELVQCRPIGG